MDASSLLPPNLIRHSDGTEEPFDPNRLHHLLFRATQLHGQADAFLSRELTDSILHFLAERADGGILTTAETVEVATAVLRELGHLSLAQAVQETVLLEKHRRVNAAAVSLPSSACGLAIQQRQQMPELAWQLARDAATTFSLEEVYPPHLVAAHREGLVTLGQLSSPRELAAVVMRWPETNLLAFLRLQRNLLGEEIVFDSPEAEWPLLQAAPDERGSWLHELAAAAQVLGLRVALHLNCRTLPAWAGEADPPLFPSQLSALAERQAALREEFLHLGAQFPTTCRLFWHYAGESAADTLTGEVLPRLLNHTQAGAEVTLVQDQPRQEIRLHQGLDRRLGALLQTVEVHLEVLAQRQGRLLSLEAFLGKTLSLARLALCAAKIRRDFLRRWRLPDWPAFLLEHAHVCLRLHGLEKVRDLLADTVSVEEVHHALAPRFLAAVAREARLLSLTTVVEVVQVDTASALALACAQASRAHTVWGRGTLSLQDHQAHPAELLSLLRSGQGLDRIVLSTRSHKPR
jgi:hypothetical protein